MNITEFKKGDILTRIEPTEKENFMSLGWTSTTSKDFSSIGDKLEFKGIKNGLIICLFHNDHEGIKPRHVTFIVARDSDGWDLYEEYDINTL